MTTPKTGAPELVESQADKEETSNEAFRRIEVGAGLFRIEDNDATAPPGSCADGACYIPAATATGAWAGKEKYVAIAVGVNAASGWYFIAPEEGMRAWVKDEDAEFAYSGSAWVAYTAAAAGGLLAANNLSDVANAGTSRSNLGLAIGSQVQAWDADLDALAALSGTNTLYYRSAANTWTAVTIGAGISFSGGTLTSTGIGGSVGSTTSGSTITPSSSNSQYEVTALATAPTIAAPSGTPVDGQKLVLRIKDNGTARALTWTTSSGGYRAVGVTLPTTTVISKVMYLGMIYNSQDSFWDVVAVAQLA